MNAEDYLALLIKKHDDFLSKQNQLNIDIFILNAGQLNFKDYFHFFNRCSKTRTSSNSKFKYKIDA